MANNDYDYQEDRIYPCDYSGICAGYGGCSQYPICAGWAKNDTEE